MDGMRAELIEALRWGERMDGEPERPAEKGRTRSQRAGGREPERSLTGTAEMGKTPDRISENPPSFESAAYLS